MLLKMIYLLTLVNNISGSIGALGESANKGFLGSAVLNIPFHPGTNTRRNYQKKGGKSKDTIERT
jgi:hypothetical protein